MTPSNIESLFTSIEFGDIDVTILTHDRDEIEFSELKKAPDYIMEIFIKDYVGRFIHDETGIPIKGLNRNLILNYC
jgi:hypothetical protein